MARAAKRRVGRPPKPAAERKRNMLSIRLRDETKGALELAATAHQRSLSEEMEARLEQALFVERHVDQMIEFAFGRQKAGWAKLIPDLMFATGRLAAFVNGKPALDDAGWINDPYSYDQAIRAVVAMLNALRPEGDTAPSQKASSRSAEAARLGERLAREALSGLARDDEASPFAVADLLGPEVAQRARDFLQRTQQQEGDGNG